MNAHTDPRPLIAPSMLKRINGGYAASDFVYVRGERREIGEFLPERFSGPPRQYRIDPPVSWLDTACRAFIIAMAVLSVAMWVAL